MTTGLRRSRSSSVVHSALALGLIAVFALATAGSARAEPTTTSTAGPTNPQRQLDALRLKTEQATETYNIARVQLRASQVKAAAVRKAMAAQLVKVQTLQADVDVMGASAYRGGNLTSFNAMFDAKGPQAVLDQLSTLQQLSKDQRAQLVALTTAQKALNAQKVTIGKEVAVQTKRTATLQAKKTAIEADLVKAQKLAVAAAAMAERASRARPARTSTRAAAFPTAPVTGSGRGATALRFAHAQMGKPYRWGGEGPGSYDCSGLTMRAWQSAGVSLPHSSRMQASSSPRVSRSQLRQGDLVFFGSPISHVAIFVSGDTVIGAPTTGDVVRYQSISRMGKGYAGATRPG